MKPITQSDLRSLTLIAKGHSAKDAAKVAGLSPWTVRDQVKRAIKSLKASNATHAVVIAIIGGIIKPEDLQ